MAGAHDVADTVHALLEHDALERADLEEVREADDETAEEVTADLLALLGRTHALALLREFALGSEPLRFSDLESTLAVSPSTLSARLSEFVEAGLLERESYDEIPPRVEYRATEKTNALAPLFFYLDLWADRYDLEET